MSPRDGGLDGGLVLHELGRLDLHSAGSKIASQLISGHARPSRQTYSVRQAMIRYTARQRNLAVDLLKPPLLGAATRS